MSTKTTKYIDLTPTWSEILPALLALLSNPITHDDALMELSRMAKLADKAYAIAKAADKSYDSTKSEN